MADAIDLKPSICSNETQMIAKQNRNLKITDQNYAFKIPFSLLNFMLKVEHFLDQMEHSRNPFVN